MSLRSVGTHQSSARSSSGPHVHNESDDEEVNPDTSVDADALARVAQWVEAYRASGNVCPPAGLPATEDIFVFLRVHKLKSTTSRATLVRRLTGPAGPDDLKFSALCKRDDVDPHEWIEAAKEKIHEVEAHDLEEANAADSLAPFFRFVAFCQANAAPLISGVAVALIFANADPEAYRSTCGDGEPVPPQEHDEGSYAADGGGHGAEGGKDDSSHIGGGSHRLLSGGGGEVDLWTVPVCPHEMSEIMSHPISLKFIANDIVMVFFFGLAAKEVTEALLPGGSLNPPSKAVNPLAATMGGVFGPILVFTLLLEVFLGLGFFQEELDSGLTKAELFNGWGVVTATDIPIAWMVARVVFGDGHPAIDYLLLLAVADDALGLVIIALFYPDPVHPTEPQWLWLTALGMLVAWGLRRWNYRRARLPSQPRQSWVPYVLVAGTLSWYGLLKARLHPALALVPIVPFMPGPDVSHHPLEEELKKQGAAAASPLEEENPDESSHGLGPAPPPPRDRAAPDAGGGKLFQDVSNFKGLVRRANFGLVNESDAPQPKPIARAPAQIKRLRQIEMNYLAKEDHKHHLIRIPKFKSFSSIMNSLDVTGAGLHGARARKHDAPDTGHSKDAYDHPDGNGGNGGGGGGHGVPHEPFHQILGHHDDHHHHESTLDDFEFTAKPVVDGLMFLFALCNAGVPLEGGIGSLTWLVLLSLVLGKLSGIFLAARAASKLGYPPPGGVWGKHLAMVGLIGAIGLTVALFVADVAYQDRGLQGDAKLGALLSGTVGFFAIGVGQVVDFKHKGIHEVQKAAVGLGAALALKGKLHQARHSALDPSPLEKLSLNSSSGDFADPGSSKPAPSFASSASPASSVQPNGSPPAAAAAAGAARRGAKVAPDPAGEPVAQPLDVEDINEP